MRINEITVESDLNEGPVLNKIGTGIGKAVGGAAKAVGAVAGGVRGAYDAAKKGYQAGKATVAGAGDEPETAAPSGGKSPAAGATVDPNAEKAAQSLQQQIDKLSPETKQELLKSLQASADKPAPAAAPAAPAAEPAAAKPTAGPGSATAGTTTAGQPKVEPDLNAPAQTATPAPKADAQARIAANPQGFDPETGKPNPAAAPAGKPAAPQNKAANDTFEKAKGDIRKVASGTKPLPDNMAQAVQADIAKMAKGDKESGVAAAQKIMGFAQRGMDIAALQQAWSANAKAGERFLSQSVYRSITNMLREHGMIWSDLNLRVRMDESISRGVFIRYARPVVESVQLFRIK